MPKHKPKAIKHKVGVALSDRMGIVMGERALRKRENALKKKMEDDERKAKRKAAKAIPREKDDRPKSAQYLDTLKMSRKICENRLIGFTEQAWHIIEPGREFKNGWAIGAVADHLEGVTQGHIQDLLINVPPGCMKSLSTSVFWPTWEWGPMNMPSMRHINFSYSPSLTVRDNRKARNILRSRWYQERWGDRFSLVGDQNAKIKFENDKTGWMLATSIGGVGTGERADRTKLDDPHNVQDGESDTVRMSTVQWFRETLSSRLNDQVKSHFVVIMQRVHEEDVSGEILAEEFGYTHLMLPMRYDGERHCRTIHLPNSRQCMYRVDADELPAWEDPRCGTIELSTSEEGKKGAELTQFVYNKTIPEVGEGALVFPELFPLEAVDKLEHRLGEYATAAQLDQLPGPRKGGMFKREKFAIINALPAGVAAYVRGWDFAGTKKVGNVSQRQAASASTLLALYRDGRTVVVDSEEHFVGPNELDALLVNTADQDGDDVWISCPQDPGQAGVHQANAMGKKLAGKRFEFTPETGDKVTRAQPFSSQVDAGNVFLLKGDWNKMYLDRMSMFPNGRMDVTDSTSRAYSKGLTLISKKQNARLGAPVNVGGSTNNAISAEQIGIRNNGHRPASGGGGGLGGVNA